MSDVFIEIPDWEAYLPAVRDDRIGRHWRPRFIVLPVAETLDVFEELTPAERGAFTTLLLEYASSPPREGDPRGARRLTVQRAVRVLSESGKSNARRLLAQLGELGRVRFVPDNSGTTPAHTSPDFTQRDVTPVTSRHQNPSDGRSAVYDGRPEPGGQMNGKDRSERQHGEPRPRAARAAKSVAAMASCRECGESVPADSLDEWGCCPKPECREDDF